MLYSTPYHRNVVISTRYTIYVGLAQARPMILCIATLLIVIVLYLIHQSGSNSVLFIHIILGLHLIFVALLAIKLVLPECFLEQELLIGGTVNPLHYLMLLSELIFHGLCAVISLMLNLSVFYCILFCCVFYVAIVFLSLCCIVYAWM